MNVLDVILIGVGLSMDAVAVSVSDGISDYKMKSGKILLIAGLFGIFQGVMPFAGFLLGSLFARFIATVAPYLAFVLLGFIGGKMIVDVIKNQSTEQEQETEQKSENGKSIAFGVIIAQAVATSVDAFAVGVNLAGYASAGTLTMPVWLACVVIACITFLLCVIAVCVGKKTGDVFSDKASLAGGIILVIIGVKMLVEGVVALL